ncbi:hypothetical protein CEK26_003684 [Fusarium fujikuroi]|nr:uncharacterized protein Y057_8492 [Fusarium fujikuroi]QGI71347.1 hypothetical protein CEK27_003676 [Fusarium fujikuroi]QGI88679.1 hypothetical protein CEK25_003635 [Fusarium fujikuroi]QGJ02240.1 hypothetical protein CEK26_003684 [Fusarium fujikuroi]SCO24040.1 uncharacterized protein FFE2_15853 [Fusarium fujikuroi]
MAVNAAIDLESDDNINPENIRIIKQVGTTLEDSELGNSLAMEQSVLKNAGGLISSETVVAHASLQMRKCHNRCQETVANLPESVTLARGCMRITAPFSWLKNGLLRDKLMPLISAKNENFQIDCPSTFLRLPAVIGGFCLSTEYRVAALSCSQRHKDFTGTEDEEYKSK